MHGITTDGSPLYPLPVTEVFGEILHQVREFQVIKELMQAIIRAVARHASN